MNDQIQPISPNIPQPKKGMPRWAPDYLKALEQTQGALTAAAKLVSLTYSAVYKARRAYPDFDKAVAEIKAEWDSKHLDELEEISIIQAKKPGCMTERFFNMKALNPSRYRDTRQLALQSGPINIILGFTPPRHRAGTEMDEFKEIEVDAEVQIPSRASRGRHSGVDILDDVDLDI